MSEFKTNLHKIFESVKSEAIAINNEVSDGDINKSGLLRSLYPVACPYAEMPPEQRDILSPVPYNEGACIYNGEVCAYFAGAQINADRIFCSATAHAQMSIGSEVTDV